MDVLLSPQSAVLILINFIAQFLHRGQIAAGAVDAVRLQVLELNRLDALHHKLGNGYAQISTTSCFTLPSAQLVQAAAKDVLRLDDALLAQVLHGGPLSQELPQSLANLHLLVVHGRVGDGGVAAEGGVLRIAAQRWKLLLRAVLCAIRKRGIKLLSIIFISSFDVVLLRFVERERFSFISGIDLSLRPSMMEALFSEAFICIGDG